MPGSLVAHCAGAGDLGKAREAGSGQRASRQAGMQDGEEAGNEPKYRS